ncbi:histone-like nucleoid-structuring protein Lsr2 [Mycobacterium sp. URHB0021]
MAELLKKTIVDDIDQSEIAEGEGERIEFGYRGVTYRIDLKTSNVTKFEKVLAPYIKAATAASTSQRRSQVEKKTSARNRRSTVRSAKADLKVVRAWAHENGYSVSSRGRVPAEIVEAFQSAHS